MIYLDTFTFPSLPERIGISGGAVYQTYSLLAGRASIPGGKDIKSVKWSGTFFGRKRRRTVLVQQWEEPAECIRFLEDAMKSGKTLNLIVDEAPINLDVTISTLSYEAVGAYGDIEYTIELEEAMKGKGWQKRESPPIPSDSLWIEAAMCTGGWIDRGTFD